MISNYDPQFLIGGHSYYYSPQFNAWTTTEVINGSYTAVFQTQAEEHHGGGFFGKFLDAIKRVVSVPINLAKNIAELGTGKQSLDNFFKESCKSYLNNLGLEFQFQGELVQILSKTGQQLYTMAYNEFKPVINLSLALTPNPVLGNTQLGVKGARFIGIDNPTIGKIDELMSVIDNKAILNTTASLLFDGTQIVGKVQERIGTYLALSTKGFPAAIQNPYAPRVLSSPTLSANIQNEYIEKIFANTFNHELVINKGVIESIEINGPKIIRYDEKLNSIQISFSDGHLKVKEGKLKHNLKINGCEFQVLPIVNLKDSLSLDFSAVITHLDLDNVNPIVDKMCAWAIQLELLDGKYLASVDINKLLGFHFDFDIKGKKDLATNKFQEQHFERNLKVRDFAWAIRNGQLNITALLNLQAK